MNGYFRTLGVPVLAGRTFLPTDRDGAPTVVVVSRTLAEGFFPGQEALGKVLNLPWTDEGIPLEVIGVVGDVCDYGLDAERRPIFYLPYRQYQGSTLRLAIRASGEVASLAPAVREAIWELEKDAPISDVGPPARCAGRERRPRSHWSPRGSRAAEPIGAAPWHLRPPRRRP